MLLLLHPVPGLFDLCTSIKPEVFWCFSAMEEVGQDVGEAVSDHVYVVVNFSTQLIFIFRLFLGMAMNANEFETKEI